MAAACSTLGGREVVQDGVRYDSRNATAPYKLGGGDVINVTVYGEEYLSGDRSITPEGTISLPLVGQVAVAGKTVNELAAHLKALYAQGYVQMPSVAVQVIQYRPVYVLGEVNQPQRLPYAPGLTAAGAVASAGGFTPRASQKYIFIDPEGDEGEKAYVNTPGLLIEPGDTVRIGERYF